MLQENVQKDPTVAVCDKVLDFIEDSAAGEPDGERFPWEIEKAFYYATWFKDKGETTKAEHVARRVNDLLDKLYRIRPHQQGQPTSEAEQKYLETAIGGMLAELEKYEELGAKHPAWGNFPVFAEQVISLGDRCLDMKSAEYAHFCYSRVRDALQKLNQLETRLGANALLKLGGLLWRCNRLPDAEQVMMEAMRIAEKDGGKQDPLAMALTKCLQDLREAIKTAT